MPYNPDLSVISIRDYKEMLKNQDLLPSRRILLEDIDQNFETIERQGIENIEQLRKSLSTPPKVLSFAASTEIPEAYLTILKREIGTLVPKSVLLDSFPDADSAKVQDLKGQGIKDLEGLL
jgi:hypothetical protein